jgi:hypothetical protein
VVELIEHLGEPTLMPSEPSVDFGLEETRRVVLLSMAEGDDPCWALAAKREAMLFRCTARGDAGGQVMSEETSRGDYAILGKGWGG